MHLLTHMKSAQAVLVLFFSKHLENMVIIMVWNPSICFCCCCSCWPINFMIASFFIASCCNSCFFSSRSSFLISFLSFRYSRMLFPLDLLFFPFPSSCHTKCGIINKLSMRVVKETTHNLQKLNHISRGKQRNALR